MCVCIKSWNISRQKGSVIIMRVHLSQINRHETIQEVRRVRHSRSMYTSTPCSSDKKVARSVRHRFSVLAAYTRSIAAHRGKILARTPRPARPSKPVSLSPSLSRYFPSAINALAILHSLRWNATLFPPFSPEIATAPATWPGWRVYAKPSGDAPHNSGLELRTHRAGVRQFKIRDSTSPSFFHTRRHVCGFRKKILVVLLNVTEIWLQQKIFFLSLIILSVRETKLKILFYWKLKLYKK